MQQARKITDRNGPSLRGTSARILVIDDHPIVAQGLGYVIEQEPDLEVCGKAETAAQAFKAIEQLNPDLVIVDISLEDASGLELVKDLRPRYPNLKVLVMSMHDEALYAQRALSAGAQGYIMKQRAMDEIVTAIRRVLSGKVYVSDQITHRILSQFTGEPTDIARSPVERLTDRELQAFQLIGQGLTTRQVAKKLHLSVKTVETYREHLKEKLNLGSGAELVRYAIHWTLEEGRQGTNPAPPPMTNGNGDSADEASPQPTPSAPPTP